LATRPVLARDDAELLERLGTRARWAALASLGAVAGLSVVRFNSLLLFADPSVLVALAITVVLAAIPFFGVGLVVAMALASGERSSRVYAADLLGAGLGAALSPFFLDRIGAPRTLLFAIALVAVASVLFEGTSTRGVSRWSMGVLTITLLVALVYRNDDPWVRPAA